MCDGALEGEDGRQPVHMGGMSLDDLRRLEAEMVVPVGRLRGAAQVHHVELRRDLVGRPSRFLHQAMISLP